MYAEFGMGCVKGANNVLGEIVKDDVPQLAAQQAERIREGAQDNSAWLNE